MADVKWIKIVTDIFDDEKILLIEQMPEGYAIIVAWFKLLCLAGKHNNSGVFTISNKIAYTDEMFSSIFRMQLNTVRLALATFERFGMIEIVNNTVTIPNWGKHQTLDKLNQRNEYMKKYMSIYRERQRALASGEPCKVNSNTNCKLNVSAPEVEGEIDKKESSSSARARIGDDDSFLEMEDAARRNGLPWHEANQEMARRLAADYSGDWVTQAIARAGLRGKQNWGMVEGILKSWKSKGGIDTPGAKNKEQAAERPIWRIYNA